MYSCSLQRGAFGLYSLQCAEGIILLFVRCALSMTYHVQRVVQRVEFYQFSRGGLSKE